MTGLVSQAKMKSTVRKGFGGWIVGILLVAVLIAVLAVPYLAYGVQAKPIGYYPFPFFFPFGFLIFFFVIFFVIRGVFWGWGWRGRGGWGYGYPGGYRGGMRYYWGDATEILRQRYARGEVTKEQFDQMMADLKPHGS